MRMPRNPKRALDILISFSLLQNISRNSSISLIKVCLRPPPLPPPVAPAGGVVVGLSIPSSREAGEFGKHKPDSGNEKYFLRNVPRLGEPPTRNTNENQKKSFQDRIFFPKETGKSNVVLFLFVSY